MGRLSCAQGGHKSTPSVFDLFRLVGDSADNIEFSPCFFELAHLNEDLGGIKVEFVRRMVTGTDKLQCLSGELSGLLELAGLEIDRRYCVVD